jgi:hypothetical protein
MICLKKRGRLGLATWGIGPGCDGLDWGLALSRTSLGPRNASSPSSTWDQHGPTECHLSKQRYEELVTLRITDQERIKARLQQQGQVILEPDGLQPDGGHGGYEVLWVVRDCLSEEILLARPLLSSTQGDITALL